MYLAITAGINSLSNAAGQADEAAAYCGGTDQACGFDIARIASSLFNFINAIANGVHFCDVARQEREGKMPGTPEKGFYADGDPICDGAPTKDDYGCQELCSASIAQAVKAAAVMAQHGSTAGHDCGRLKWADNAKCGEAVSGTFATFAVLTQAISTAIINCNGNVLKGTERTSYGSAPFRCADNFATIAGMGSTLSGFVGAAQMHCPFTQLAGGVLTPRNHAGGHNKNIPANIHRQYFQPPSR